MTSPVTSYVPARSAGFAVVAPTMATSAVAPSRQPRILFMIPSSPSLLLELCPEPVGDRFLTGLGPDVIRLERVAAVKSCLPLDCFLLRAGGLRRKGCRIAADLGGVRGFVEAERVASGRSHSSVMEDERIFRLGA